MLAILLFVVLLSVKTDTKITDKEYAQMPPLFQLDDYDTCMDYGDEALYCTITYELQPLNPDNPSRIWGIIKEVSSNPINYRHDHMRHGVCIPTTCANITWTSRDDARIKEGLTDCYNKKYERMGLNGTITKIRCETTERPYAIDNFDIFVAVVSILYVAFVLFASFYEGIARYNLEKYETIMGTWHGKIMTAFSIPKNWDRLKSINTENPDVQSLRVIQGVRFYNMVCVIMTHTIMIALAMPVSNPRYTETMTQKILNMFIANGGFAVQTFFMISGWLLTYHFFLAYEGKKSIKFTHLVWIFINRYIRLTPTLAVIIGLHSSWLVQFARGPNWDLLVGEEYRRCRKNGWSNLLYINNYIDADYMCIAQTWYVGIDTQLFIVALISIWLMWNYPKKIPLIIGSLLFTHSFLTVVVSYLHNYECIVRPYSDELYGLEILKRNEWYLISSTYSNMAGLACGLMYGYIFYKTRKMKLEIFTKKYFVILWWIVVWSGSFFIILLSSLKIFDENYKRDFWFELIFGSVCKIIFSLSIGLVMFGVTQGIGGPAKLVLEWPPTYYLGRLTYSAYLVHSILIRIRGGTRRSLMYLNDYLLFNELFSDIGLAYLCALLLVLFVEMPLTQLQKMVLPQKTTEEKKEK